MRTFFHAIEAFITGGALGKWRSYLDRQTRRRGRRDMGRLRHSRIQISSNSVIRFSHSPRRFISPSTLHPSSLNGFVYDTSVTFGMHVAISKQRFLYRSILRGHFVTSRSLNAPVMAFALHATKTFGNVNHREKRKGSKR